MPRQSTRQKEIVGRVMHEFKHGELERPQGGKVKNRRQAVAIGLSEAGASNRQSPGENSRRRRKTEAKERRGQTAQQQKEGRSAPERSLRTSGKARQDGHTRAELYEIARERGIDGRSRMSKSELERAVARH